MLDYEFSVYSNDSHVIPIWRRVQTIDLTSPAGACIIFRK